MGIINKLGTETAKDYFSAELAAANNAYMSEDGNVYGRWSGALAEQLGLTGRVSEEQYMRLIDGQHPETGEQLIQHRDTRLTRDGKESAHVPAWDITLSVPKSISIVATVGGDERIYRIAEQANQEALAVFQKYSQAKGGGHKRDINTGEWIIATFRHGTSRPVDGYSAPQIHYHNIMPNLARDEHGKFRAMQTQELYKAQSLALQAFYDSLARGLRGLGYNVDFAEGYAPEIRGISREYIEHESDRREAIRRQLEEKGWSGGRASQLAALSTREAKLDLTPSQFLASHIEHGKEFASELRVVEAAIERGPVQVRQSTAEAAVTHAARSLSERNAIFEHFELEREALRYSLGTVDYKFIEAEIQKRVAAGDLVPRHHYRDYAPGARYSTAETLRAEHETVQLALAGQNTVSPILDNADLAGFKKELPAGNTIRIGILKDILATRDQVVALNGVAGSAKSSACSVLGRVAEQQGYRVKGLAPTGTAARSLGGNGISSETLQMHLTRSKPGGKGKVEKPHQKTFYIVDETSLAATKNIRDFFRTLKPEDHVLLVGDDAADQKKVGQHTSVEAGRVFQLLQEAGIKTAHFNKIYRQKDPALLDVVNSFRNGDTERGLDLLQKQARIHEHDNSRTRYEQIAKAYVGSSGVPKGALVVSADNASRMLINEAIRTEMREQGQLSTAAYKMPILIGRDLTTAQTSRASAYRVGDIVQFRKGNKQAGVKAREYATVIERDTDTNTLTVKKANGRVVAYDPAQAKGVNIFETRDQEFSAGERIQFLAKDKKLGASTRDLATIRQVDQHGNAKVVLDRNSKVHVVNLKNHRHIDHAYAMTSQAAQSKTVGSQIINIDTGDPKLRGLLNEVFAYVATSRPEYDLRVFADDASRLLRVLSRENEQQKALSPEQTAGYREKAEPHERGRRQEQMQEEHQAEYYELAV